MKKEDEFFDATVEPVIEEKPQEIYEARAKAETHNKVRAEITDDTIAKQNKNNFVKLCIMSVSSVLFFLILAIVFFVYLHWYGVGIGCAIIGIVISQIWVHFFKKLYKNNEYEADLEFINDNLEKHDKK